jgi:hypothetical protein
MRSASDKSCWKIQNTQFLLNNFFPKIAVYENAEKYLEPDMTQMTMWHMGIACWIPKATDTHAECVILIAFPLQQWLLESTSVLLYAHIACLV